MATSIAIRVQDLDAGAQVQVLARLAETRTDSGRFAPAAIDALFDELGLPRPAKVSNVLANLERKGLVARSRHGRGSWKLTPKGRRSSTDLVDEMDLSALSAEASGGDPPAIGHVLHPVVPPWLAPPELLMPLRGFLNEHPFETNVFGMTRFPDEQDDTAPDPVASALEEARDVCRLHGMEFHLASDRKIVDDLWANVAAHMWACKYGVGFFEDRRGRGVNYNLSIEVGGMLTTGRRLALIKDRSISSMPTDLVGRIYSSVDLERDGDVGGVIHAWLRDDLRLGSCGACP